MARQRVPLQVNQFVSGLNTEANPLSYPADNSFDEQNMEFERDGGRSRRPGFDVEQYYNEVSTGVPPVEGASMARTQFLWENAGNNPNVSLMVIQLGGYVAVHDATTVPLSSAPLYTAAFGPSTYSTRFGMASVDGNLILTNGQANVYILKYSDGSVTLEAERLLVRDFWGVQAVADTLDLTDPENYQYRPKTLTQFHKYNLRNQTYGLPRAQDFDTTATVDPINKFREKSNFTRWPSNADNLVNYLYPDSTFSTDRFVERYFAGSHVRTKPPTSRAPMGHYIIDALARGPSRLAAVKSAEARYSEFSQTTSFLPADTTPEGAKVVAEYASRAWFAGFSGEVIGGDSKSPSLGSYVLFSQQIQDDSNLTRCYQEADPTSNEDPELVDTDGGFIKIDGAYDIVALVALGTFLFVFAKNGVWAITGLDGNSFTATGYTVMKITDVGCISGGSVVVNKDSVVYWAEDAIYGIASNETGSWESQNLTEQTIQTLYDSLSVVEKKYCVGYHDDNTNEIRWVYGDERDSNPSKELILNFRYTSWTKTLVNSPTSGARIVALAGAETFLENADLFVTTTLGEDVTDDTGELVTVSRPQVGQDITKAYYLILTQLSPTIKYTFGRYNREDTTYDWTRYGDPTDSPALLQTGPITGGDARLRKDVPYLTTYFLQTNPDSSCLVRAKWGWSPSIETGRWTTPRQAYRPRRSSQEGGVLATRNKIRGGGKAIAFLFESEEGKDFRIYGWEFNLQAASEE